MIRYAVVGAGWISQEAFLPGAHQTGNSRVTAIVSGNAGRAAELASFHDVPEVVPYAAYDDLLASDRIDAVYIALPNSMHADYAIRAARAGKHILVEKPLADNLRDAEAMVAAAREAGVFLMTAYRLHNEPGNLTVLDHIHSGAIGKPMLAQLTFSNTPGTGNHRFSAEHWGGPMQDVGVYCINAARHIFAEEPVEVTAVRYQTTDDPRFAEVDASVAATLRFPSGGIAQLIASFGAALVEHFRVIGTKGDISLDPAFRFEVPMQMRLTRNGTTEQIDFPHIDHFAGMTAYFSDCITNGTPPEPDGEEGLADMLVLVAIEEAAKTGKAVQISTPPRPSHPNLEMVRRCELTQRRLVF
ncbi:Gfo/Idh/MocA family protein [Oceanicola sp. 502str15]|uniref:Gfo/Idh/MocA family protein n=1 Tax=Oceanicola sp. 502str15 TaxID=2696061 RepID=UPI0020965C1F|nr:Gfo/Idh/MocA family oxidoreductase [Oceanicola sp. 502str15]MCO6384116.1 Gfo/Idh/MocA family oxidoreductase [Oceanicola sp. 502str15]